MRSSIARRWARSGCAPRRSAVNRARASCFGGSVEPAQEGAGPRDGSDRCSSVELFDLFSSLKKEQPICVPFDISISRQQYAEEFCSRHQPGRPMLRRLLTSRQRSPSANGRLLLPPTCGEPGVSGLLGGVILTTVLGLIRNRANG